MDAQENFLNLTAIFITCQKYKDLWPLVCFSSLQLKNKYGVSTVVCSDEPLNQNDVDMFCSFGILEVTSSNYSFSSRVDTAVRTANTKYVLLLLDDYFVPGDVSFSFSSCLSEIERFGISYYRLSKSPSKGKSISKKTIVLCREQKYAINTHPSIWKSSVLINLMANRKLSPWEFESFFNRINISKELVPFRTKKDFFPFIEVVARGKYLPKSKKIVESYGLKCQSRQTIGRFVFFRMELKRKIRSFLPVFIQKILIKMDRRKLEE